MFIGEGAPLAGHTRAVTALAVHDGLLYSSANDCTVRLWDGPQLLMTLAEGVDPCGSLSVLRDRTVKVPRLAATHAATHRSRSPPSPPPVAQGCPLGSSGEPLPRGFRSEPAASLWCAFSNAADPIACALPRRDRIVSTAHAGGAAVSLWRYSLLQVKARSSFALPAFLAKLRGGDAAVRVAGGRAAAAAAASQSQQRVTSDLECLHTFVETDNAVHTALLFGEGEGALLTASWTGEVQAWDLGRRRMLSGWSYGHFGHQSPVCALALCGALVCTASHDLTLRIARCLPGDAEARPERDAGAGDSIVSDAELVNDMDAPLVSAEVAEEFRWKGFGEE